MNSRKIWLPIALGIFMAIGGVVAFSVNAYLTSQKVRLEMERIAAAQEKFDQEVRAWEIANRLNQESLRKVLDERAEFRVLIQENRRKLIDLKGNVWAMDPSPYRRTKLAEIEADEERMRVENRTAEEMYDSKIKALKETEAKLAERHPGFQTSQRE